MKIAFFNDTYLPTINGITYTIYNWKKELEKRGHDVTVICPAPGGSNDNVTFKSVNFPLYDGFRASFFPPFRHDFSEYDLVHIHSYFMVGVYGSYVASRHNIPMVTSVHTPIEDFVDYLSSSAMFQKYSAKMYAEWESYLINKSDLCLTPTHGRKEDIKDRVLRDVKVLSNGVDTTFFEPVDDAAFRKRHNIESDRVIGYTGRLGKEKRLEELFALADEFEGEIIVGGDGPAREQYEDICKDKENVTFLGFLERKNLPELYSCLDVFVFPSRVEAEGLVVLEANACGTPVVGADAKGLKTSIVNDVNGYRYEPGDVNDLQSKIDRVFKNMGALRQSAIEKAQDRSLSKTVDKLVNYYKGVLENTQNEKESARRFRISFTLRDIFHRREKTS